MFRLNTPRAAAAIAALALAASAAPASARVLDLNADGSQVPAGSLSTQALNPSPRGVAIVLGRTPSGSPAVRANPNQQTSKTSNPGVRHQVRAASLPRCPVRGPCISPESMLTQGLRLQAEAAALGHDRGASTQTKDLTYGEKEAAALGYNGGTYGAKEAAALGYNGGTYGAKQAAALGYNGGTYGAKEAAALSFNGGAVAQSIGSPTAGSSSSSHSPGPTAASSGETFGWGDAGIGAAGMLLLVSGGVAVAVMTRRQRHRVTAS